MKDSWAWTFQSLDTYLTHVSEVEQISLLTVVLMGHWQLSIPS